MSACGCAVPPAVPVEDEGKRPWWRDRHVMIPVWSGVALLGGLAAEWSGAGVAAQILFWIGLLLGASTFVPGSLRNLFSKRRLGIGLLMTISAIGAVILGFVEEAAALAFLYSISEALEDRAMDRARAGLRSLLTLVPETATVRRGGLSVEVSAEELRIGDLLLVRPGERVATDGLVRSGRSSLDTSAITGESIPVAVAPGDRVSAGSINASGALEIEAGAPGVDNSLTKIVDLVEQAQSEKGQRARLADRLARPLVPGVLVLALLVGVIGSLFGDPATWITRALVVLVAASPCAMAISVPVTVVSAIGAATRFGVVIKSGAAFERFGTVGHLAVDKTGTLTRNEPIVTAIVSTTGASRADVLRWAAAVEEHSTHPLATAITTAFTSSGPDAPAQALPAASAVREEPGQGLIGQVDGATISVGSPRWLGTGALAAEVERFEAEGMSVVVIARDGIVVGAIGVRDELRPEVPAVIEELTAGGTAVTMLTGDNARTAQALAQAAGIADVRAELRPEDKAAAVRALAERQPTAMIGDGINDAPALAAADVGIAMGVTGSDAAIESADVAFTGHDLRLIPQALAHARRGRRIINQNIVLSALIIIVLLPLAITGLLGLAAVVLVHEVAEVIVILNGLRAARAPRATVGARPEGSPESTLAAPLSR
ncbi:heavy metal translocating P-type ATPase [Granulicoccus sp. GXG6511]|uniref:heavy metal translocating P-type ATPase n=1 Tax=Granulicoccus sp. GXG6511 TaxID=3381351 RepID=UPI003D7D8105